MSDTSTTAVGLTRADGALQAPGRAEIPTGGLFVAESSAPRTWSLIVPGEPIAKGRPRIGVVRGHAMAFTPAKTRSYESEIRALAYQSWQPRLPLDAVPIVLTMNVYRSIPTSWSQKKQAAAREGNVRPIVKPDLDNHLKCVDALLGVVVRDDALIVEATVRKFYSDRPRMEIALSW